MPAPLILLFSLLFLAAGSVSAQPEIPETTSLKPISSTYRNLVLEGGGIRGIAYGGVFQVLESEGMLKHIERVGGTSAGAIQALLLTVGYTAQEITEITYSTPIGKFNDGRLFFLGGWRRTARQYGWYRGEKFRNWLGDLVAAKTGNADLTFAQLHAKVGQPGYRDLYVTATNLSTQQIVVLSHETYPNMKLRDAVRISMSIPLYYRAVFMDDNGQIVKKPKPGQRVQVLIDGGVLANFPIGIFDRPRYFASPVKAAPDSVVFNPETLGIRLDRDEQILYDQHGKGLAPFEIGRFSDYLKALYTITLENLNRSSLSARDWERTVSVSTVGINPRVRHMKTAEKEKLLESGVAGMRAFLNRKTAP